MHISVAICTYNRATLLGATLSRLGEIAQPEDATWEVVVVDNASTDHTQTVLRTFHDRLPLRVVEEPNGGLSHARNRALDHVQGDYVLWTDDDVQVDRNWLASFVAGVRRFPDGTVFGGPVSPWFPMPPDLELLEAFPALGLGFCGVDHQRPAGFLPDSLNINGANMAFHRGRTGALRFDPAFGMTPTGNVGGDERNFIDRCRSAGAAVVWLPDMQVRHYVMRHRMSLPYLLSYYRDLGVTTVRREGIPPGSQWFGVPRWLLREVLVTGIKTTLLKPFISRQRYLLALRSHHYSRGVIAECVAQGATGSRKLHGRE